MAILTTEQSLPGNYTRKGIIHATTGARPKNRQDVPKVTQLIDATLAQALLELQVKAAQVQADGVIGITHTIVYDIEYIAVTVMGTAVKF